jgi:hypothetical protein
MQPDEGKIAVANTRHDRAAWLQATADPAGYDEQAARLVFDVLAPVLIGGRARRTPTKFQPPLAYDVNADDHRREDA